MNRLASLSTPFSIKDLSAGLASAIVAIIAGVGFGELSGLGATAGMITTTIVGLIGALMGGAPFMVRSTTGAIVVIVADMVGLIQSAGPNTALHLPLFITLAFVISAFTQWLLGYFRLGKMVFYVPQSIVKGFISGVGLLIIRSQSAKIFEVIHSFTILEWLLLGGTILYMLFGKYLLKSIPAIVVPFIAGGILQHLGPWKSKGISASDAINSPNFFTYWSEEVYQSFDLSWIWSQSFTLDLLLLGLAITFISSMDALMIGVAADRISKKDDHKPDRELRALGLGNAISALFGGLPGSGIMGGTAVNLKAGARSGYAAILAALLVGMATLFTLPLILSVPAVVIDGIILIVGFQLIDYSFIKSIRKVPNNDLVVFFSVLTLTIAVNLVYAILIGFSIASIFFMKRMSDVISAESEQDTESPRIKKMKSILVDHSTKHASMDYVALRQIKGPLFFGVTNRFAESLKELPSGVKYLILNFQLVPYIDFSGVDELHRIRRKLQEKGVELLFCGLKQEAQETLQNFDPQQHKSQSIYQDPEQALLAIYIQEEALDLPVENTAKVAAVLDMEDTQLNQWLAKALWKQKGTLRITDHQGRTMFESSDKATSWNGKYRNRIACTSGIYQYTLSDESQQPYTRGLLVLV